jgi:N utilization substance protein B
MKRRTKSREYLFQFIYFWQDAKGINWRESIPFFEQNLQSDQLDIDREFTYSLIEGIIVNREQLVAAYSNYIKRAPNRVNEVILLIGVYELKFTDGPYKVIINEAINLAHKFSAEDSSSFINGILDRVANE